MRQSLISGKVKVSNYHTISPQTIQKYQGPKALSKQLVSDKTPVNTC